MRVPSVRDCTGCARDLGCQEKETSQGKGGSGGSLNCLAMACGLQGPIGVGGASGDSGTRQGPGDGSAVQRLATLDVETAAAAHLRQSLVAAVRRERVPTRVTRREAGTQVHGRNVRGGPVAKRAVIVVRGRAQCWVGDGWCWGHSAWGTWTLLRQWWRESRAGEGTDKCWAVVCICGDCLCSCACICGCGAADGADADAEQS